MKQRTRNSILAEAIRAAGITQQEAAARAGFPFPTLRAVIDGLRSLSVERATRLVEVVHAAARAAGVVVDLRVDDIPRRLVITQGATPREVRP